MQDTTARDSSVSPHERPFCTRLSDVPFEREKTAVGEVFLESRNAKILSLARNVSMILTLQELDMDSMVRDCGGVWELYSLVVVLLPP